MNQQNGHGADVDLQELASDVPDEIDTDTENVELDLDDESVRDKRVQEILARKQECIDMRKDARMAVTLENAPKHKAESGYRATLEAYVAAIQPLLHQGDGPDYWRTKNYGTLILSPPGRPADSIHQREKWELPDGETLPFKPDATEVEITGLKSLFDLGDPIRATVDVRVSQTGLNRGRATEPYPTQGQLTFGMLDDMLIDVNNHVAACGIGIGTDDDDRWQI